MLKQQINNELKKKNMNQVMSNINKLEKKTIKTEAQKKGSYVASNKTIDERNKQLEQNKKDFRIRDFQDFSNTSINFGDDERNIKKYLYNDKFRIGEFVGKNKITDGLRTFIGTESKNINIKKIKEQEAETDKMIDYLWEQIQDLNPNYKFVKIDVDGTETEISNNDATIPGNLGVFRGLNELPFDKYYDEVNIFDVKGEKKKKSFTTGEGKSSFSVEGSKDNSNILYGGGKWKNIEDYDKNDIDSIFDGNKLDNKYDTVKIDKKQVINAIKNCDEIQKYIIIKNFELNEAYLTIYREYMIFHDLITILNNIILFFEGYPKCKGLDKYVFGVKNVINTINLINENFKKFGAVNKNKPKEKKENKYNLVSDFNRAPVPKPVQTQFRRMSMGGGGPKVPLIKESDLKDKEHLKELLRHKIKNTEIKSLSYGIKNFGNNIKQHFMSLLDSIAFVGPNGKKISNYNDKYKLYEEFISGVDSINTEEFVSKHLYASRDNKLNYLNEFSKKNFKKIEIDLNDKKKVENIINICHEKSLIVMSLDKKLFNLLIYLYKIYNNISTILSFIRELLELLTLDNKCDIAPEDKINLNVIVDDFIKTELAHNKIGNTFLNLSEKIQMGNSIKLVKEIITSLESAVNDVFPEDVYGKMDIKEFNKEVSRILLNMNGSERKQKIKKIKEELSNLMNSNVECYFKDNKFECIVKRK